METLIKNIEKYLQSFNVEQLYKDPGHKDSKDWLAGITAALKVGGRRSYKEFKNFSQHMYPSVSMKTRKHAAEQIDVFLRQIIEQYKSEATVSNLKPQSIKNNNGKNINTRYYVNKSILEGFQSKKSTFNYQKLIALIEELNFNYLNRKTYSSCMILRAILDHIPPLLAKKDFSDVVNTYNWGSEKSSPRKAIKNLLTFRNIPDHVLHGQITNRRDIIEFDYLPDRFSVNTLLQECLESDTEFHSGVKSAKSGVVKNNNNKSDLIIDFYEPKISWANYSVGRWLWSSFKMVLTINNAHSKSSEYISPYLFAKSNDGVWEAKNFIFLNRENENKSRPNEDLRIEPEYKEIISLFVSAYEIEDREQKPMPDIDMDTLRLVIKTESGKIFTLPIKAGWVTRG